MLVDMGDILSSSGSGQLVALYPDGGTFHTLRIAADCYSGVKLDNDGLQYRGTSSGGWTSLGAGYWRLSGSSGDYYARATLNSGTLDWSGSSATGSWLQLSTDRYWGLVSGAAMGIEEASVTVEIDTVGDGSNIIATVTYTLFAESEAGY